MALGTGARFAAVAALLLASAAARAQSDTSDEERRVTAALRGGFSGYTGPLARFLGLGYAWGAQLSERSRNRIFGLEAAYEGSSTTIKDMRLPQPHRMVRHGLQGLAKLFLPFRLGELQPFVGAGLGLSYAYPAGPASSATNFLYTNGLFAEVPLAAGVEYEHGFFSAGARVSLNPMIGASFAAQAAPGKNPTGSVLDALLQAGARF